MKYGGHGYSHILLNILPKMAARGISPEVIDKIMVQNPRHWLQFWACYVINMSGADSGVNDIIGDG